MFITKRRALQPQQYYAGGTPARRRGMAGLGDDTSTPVTFDTGTAAPYAPVPIDTSAPTSAATDVLNFFKSALPIYQGQVAFNQQLKAGTLAAPAPKPAPTPASNMGKIALIGGAGVLALMLFRGMSRR